MKYLIRLLFGCWLLSTPGNAQSVLATGSWLKIGITKDGIYKLDAATLTRAGWNTAQIDPRLIRLYGNGGAPLPQANLARRPQDLQENAIQISGESDGRLDPSDVVYFYGKSPHEVTLDTLKGQLAHQLNPYCDTTYYFLTVGTTPGKRVQDRPSALTGTSLTTYDEYLFHESEAYNRVKSGRIWYGESFNVTSNRSIPFAVPGAIANTPAYLTSATLGYASVSTSFEVQVNGTLVGTQAIGATSYERYDYKGVNAVHTYPLSLTSVPSDGTITVDLTYKRNGDNAAVGFLNYLGLQVQRSLAWRGTSFRFRSLNSRTQPLVQMQVANAPADLQIWNISGIPVRMGVSNGSFSYAPQNQVQEFLAFTPTTAEVPASIRTLASQNIHAVSTPALLIITAPSFRTEAERLAAFRRTHDQLSTEVVSTEEIFNEFSSGSLDPTALRDFIRHLFLKKEKALRYVLLLGDATYDYKNILGENTSAGYVPIYESRESLHPIYSYSSDDYYGFLKEHEGEWPEDFSGDHTLDVGIGRLPVKSVSEAREVVDKLIRYENPDTRGPWQTKLSFIADDGDYNIHAEDSERLSGIVQRTPYQSEKLYLDAFPQTGTGLDQKSPQANQALNKAIRDGRLLVSFAGHGGVSGWTQEQILTLRDILGWRNRNQMPLFLTATCEFGRYDDPAIVSGAELSFLNANGGGIALLTTTRPVFASSNFLVSEAFMKAAFQPINGAMPRLGDLIRITKNNSLSGRINRNFALLGDPSLQLAYPKQSVSITHPDTLKAGALVSIQGNVSFDGNATIEVYDQEQTVQTLGDESSPFRYKDRKSILYKGTIPVRNGTFRTTFTVPTGIYSGVGPGVVRVYAVSSDGKTNALGVSNPWVGGVAPSPVTDVQSPTLVAYLNNSDFQNGSIVDANPVLIAQVSDDTGLSYTEKNPMTATLNDTLTIPLNEYYTPTDSRSGEIRYSFKNLPTGSYQLTIRAFDVVGKSVEKLINFSVNAYTKAQLTNVRVMPNPFHQQARFSFEHQFLDNDTEISIYLYDLSGRLVHSQTIQSYVTPSPYEDLQLTPGELATGMYIYRIFVRSLSNRQVVSGSGKISHIK